MTIDSNWIQYENEGKQITFRDRTELASYVEDEDNTLEAVKIALKKGIENDWLDGLVLDMVLHRSDLDKELFALAFEHTVVEELEKFNALTEHVLFDPEMLKDLYENSKDYRNQFDSHRLYLVAQSLKTPQSVLKELLSNEELREIVNETLKEQENLDLIKRNMKPDLSDPQECKTIVRLMNFLDARSFSSQVLSNLLEEKSRLFEEELVKSFQGNLEECARGLTFPESIRSLYERMQNVHVDYFTYLALLSNPSTPPDVMEDLFQRRYDLRIATHLFLDKLQLSEKCIQDLYHALTYYEKTVVASRLSMSKELMLQLLTDPATNIEIKGPGILCQILKKPNCPAEAVMEAINTNNCVVKKALIFSSHCPKNVLIGLTKDEDKDVRKVAKQKLKQINEKQETKRSDYER